MVFHKESVLWGGTKRRESKGLKEKEKEKGKEEVKKETELAIITLLKLF